MASPWGPDAGLIGGRAGLSAPEREEPLAEAASLTPSHPVLKLRLGSRNLMGQEHPAAS